MIGRRWLVLVVTRCGQATLLLYPRWFRALYGNDMVDVLGDVCRGGGQGAVGNVGGALRALALMARNGVGERFQQGTTPPPISPKRPRPARGERASFVSSFLQDVGFGVRSLIRRPAFSLLAIAMVAFGIAANTTVFTLFNAVFLRPLPFPQPERLLNLDETAPEWGLDYVGISYPDFHAWREANRTFEAMAVFDVSSYNLATEGRADRVSVALVSEDLLTTLGLEVAVGRPLLPTDHEEGAETVVLLTDAAWTERFARQPSALGTTLRLDGSPATIVGVLPPEAVYPSGVDLWAPLSVLPFCCGPTQRAGSWWLTGVGRLHGGVTVAEALDDLQAAHAPLVEEFGSSRAQATPRIQPLTDRYLGNVRPLMRVMLAAVGVLLVIACANLGGLLLARGTSRHREMSIRLALGAGRGRVVRQLLTESGVLALAGGLVGLLAARFAVTRVVDLIPAQQVGWLQFGFDARVFAFALGISAIAAVLFGLAPAMMSSSRAPQAALQSAGLRTSAGPGARRALASLVVVEMSLAVVLLVSAGLLVQATRALNDVQPGFREDVLTFAASLPSTAYEDHHARMAFFDQLVERIAASPGVDSVGLANHTPFGGHTGNFFAADDTILNDDTSPVVLTRFASPEYFATMGIELVDGRTFDDFDGREARATIDANNADDDHDNDIPVAAVVVVNETFARTFWGTNDVLGRTIRSGDTVYTVVGITRDTKHYGLDVEMRPGIFLPHRLTTTGTMVVAVRGGTDPLALTPMVRELMREVDPEVPMFGEATMAELAYRSTWQRRLAMTLIGVFASAALVLSLSGIYGTMSYAVGQRRREIGIRLALGAGRAQVVRQVMATGAALTGAGLVIGLGLAAAVAGFLSSILFGISVYDPTTYAVVGVALALAGALATVVPAQRAAGTRPVTALRAE